MARGGSAAGVAGVEGGEGGVGDGGEGGMDGGGGGSGTTRVFVRGPTGESPAVGVDGARLFGARTPSCSCEGGGDDCCLGGGGGSSGCDGVGGGIGAGGGSCGSCGVCSCMCSRGVAARLQKSMMLRARKACAFCISAAYSTARARDFCTRLDGSGFGAVPLPSPSLALLGLGLGFSLG